MARLTGTVALLMSVAGLALAQEDAPATAAEDLTLPPVITEAPGDVRLEPAPEDREGEGIEVLVTGGETDWRLPDLGTSLREEEERPLDQRMEFVLAPYYDPEKQVEMLEPVPVVDVMRDLGFLRIFEVGFGRRSRQNDPQPEASTESTSAGEAQHEPPEN
jgi:hypothetical protein